MHWFRTNRRFGSWCALFAIAIQVIVSFGHAHRIDSFRGGELLTQAAQALNGQSKIQPDDPASKPIGKAFDYCAICVAIDMGASAMPADAPASAIPVVAAKVRFALRAEATAPNSGHRLFQARAPPTV